MQSEYQQVLTIKGKDRHVQWYSHKSTDGEQSQMPFTEKVENLSRELNSWDILNLHAC